jgi:sulfoquinovosyltransferase
LFGLGVEDHESTNVSSRRQFPLKISILTEPSPIGSYICGQSKRIEYLLQYLVEETNDNVELITTEVHDKVKPTLWKNKVAVQYTHGFKLPRYEQISISFDWTGKALRRFCNFRPDLIHTTTPGPLLFPSIIASRLFGIPLVMSCHTHLTAYAKTYLPPVLNTIAEWYLWKFTAIVHSFADLTLVTSPQIREDFVTHGIKRVEVWQKGVNCTQFNPKYADSKMRRRMTDGHPQDFLITYIGRLAEEKRLTILRGVLERIPGARLCLVGTGPYEVHLREYFQDTNTVFLGQISDRTELSKAFASADVFCMPSTSETLGFVVLESMASQVPVVAANEGGLKYLIENERTGFLVTPDDDSEFAAWILQLKSDKDLRHRISIAARKEVEDYTWQRSMEEVRFSFYPSAQENFFRRWEQRFLRKLNHMLPVTNQNK